MKIKAFTPLKQEQAQDLPESFFRVLQPIQTQVDDMTRAMQGRIDGANLTEETLELDLLHNTPVRVRLQRLQTLPKHATLTYTGHFDYAHLAWRIVDFGVVEVKVKWDNPPAVRVRARILFRGGE